MVAERFDRDYFVPPTMCVTVKYFSVDDNPLEPYLWGEWKGAKAVTLHGDWGILNGKRADIEDEVAVAVEAVLKKYRDAVHAASEKTETEG